MTDKLKLKHGGWLVVADGEKALFLQNIGDEKYPHLEVFREEEQDNPPNREQAANRRGRFNDGPSVHRSAVDDTDWHRMGKERFAKEMAEILYRNAHRGVYDEVIVVAPPLILGELRKEYHKEVESRVVGELPNTLTGHPVDEIETLVLSQG